MNRERLYKLIISIPAPARGATLNAIMKQVTGQFQFPPLREGRRSQFHSVRYPTPISIPAPARGATREQFARGCEFAISIPAPARGAT